jgi:hypothetical protein
MALTGSLGRTQFGHNGQKTDALITVPRTPPSTVCGQAQLRKFFLDRENGSLIVFHTCLFVQQFLQPLQGSKKETCSR